MKKLLALSFSTTVLAVQNAQAHSSHSEGMMHASEHLWLALIPAVLWIVYSVGKGQIRSERKSRQRKQG